MHPLQSCSWRATGNRCGSAARQLIQTSCNSGFRPRQSVFGRWVGCLNKTHQSGSRMAPDSNAVCDLLPQAKQALNFFRCSDIKTTPSALTLPGPIQQSNMPPCLQEPSAMSTSGYVDVICCHQAAQILKSFSKVLAFEPEHQPTQPLGKLGKRDGLELPRARCLQQT